MINDATNLIIVIIVNFLFRVSREMLSFRLRVRVRRVPIQFNCVLVEGVKLSLELLLVNTHVKVEHRNEFEF